MAEQAGTSWSGSWKRPILAWAVGPAADWLRYLPQHRAEIDVPARSIAVWAPPRRAPLGANCDWIVVYGREPGRCPRRGEVCRYAAVSFANTASETSKLE